MPLPFIIGILGTIGSAAAAAGTAVVAAGGTIVAATGTIAAATWAAIASAPVLTATVVGALTVSSMLDDAERNGRKEGFKDGYRRGCIDTSRKFAESTEEHVAKVCGMYGLGVYMGFMDGRFDENDRDVLLEVLGSPRMLEEYVHAEVNKVVNMQHMKLSVIMEKYVNKVGADGIRDCDCAVKDFVNAYRRKGHDVSDFYNNIWKPYFNGRV